MSAPTIRLLVVDSQPLVRWALVHLADDQEDLTPVGEAATAIDALSLAASLLPDVVTIDASLPGDSGWDLAVKLRARFPEMGLVMLAAESSDALLLRALEAGLSGFVVKSAPLREVVSIVRHAASAATSFTASGLGEALRRRYADAEPTALSPRELQVLQMLQQGSSVPMIAADLYLSLSTAKTYVARVYDKLGASNRAQALMTAVRLGVLDVNHTPVAV